MDSVLYAFGKISNNPPPKSNYKNKNKKNSYIYNQNYLKNSYNTYNFQNEKELNTNYENDNESNDNKNNTYNIYQVGRTIDNYYNEKRNNSKRSTKKSKKKVNYDNYSSTSNSIRTFKEEEISTTTKKSNSSSKLYCINIKNKHKLISIFNNNKYDIRIYKISLFILTITLDLLFCCLFDTSSNISKLYEKQKIYTGKEILIGIYSLLSSYLITKIIDCFMEYKNKLEDYKNNIDNSFDDYISCLKIKFIFYFVFNLIITGFAWYIVSLFCSTYPKSIINLLICFTCNFVISFFIPFIYYGFVSCIQSKSISNENPKCYKFSLFLLKL